MPPALFSRGASVRPSTRLLALAALTLAVGAAARPALADTGTIATSYSSNWSGYAAIAPAGSTFTDVTGSWIVPAVTASSADDTYSSTWIGLDGYNSTTVEQIGTASEVVNGVAVYYPWVEYYPAPEVDLSSDFTISAGDSMSAEVSYKGVVTGRKSTPYLGDYEFVLTLIDNTDATDPNYQGLYDGVIYTYYSDTAPDLSSAEWVTEAPGLDVDGVDSQSTLANYGTVNFTSAGATLGSGTPVSISSLDYTDINMVQNDQIVSLATGLTDGGEDFSTLYAGPVPEPASLGMLAFGGMALLLRRRKC